VPPKPEDMLKALHKTGIEADPGLFDNLEQLPGFYMSRYQDNPEYDEGFFQIESDPDEAYDCRWITRQDLNIE
jgi:hypothetical protein